ncbi:MAG: uroporphyrinogen decarboxylase family protein [Candidatus Bathyarchaeia archaeon]
MNSRERVQRTVNFEESDTTPITELDVDVSVMEKILGRSLNVEHSLQAAITTNRRTERAYYDALYEVYSRVGFDILYAYESLPDGCRLEKLPDGRLMEQMGRVFSYDEVAKAYTPVGSIFKTAEDVMDFLDERFPNPYAPGRDYGIKYLAEINRGDKALGIFIREPFAHVWEALTPFKFVYWMHSEPSIVVKFIEKVTEYNLGLIDVYGELGFIDLIVMGGDLCDVKGPMLPPAEFRRLKIFDAMRKHVDEAHKHGIKFIKHTDGNVKPILGDLIETSRVDGVHSLDPSAGVDIGWVKEEFQDRLILHGNVSVDNLATKSVAEIIEETKNAIRNASPGGGHILSSSNSWYGDVKIENCNAMVETGRRYGKYPIKS